MGFAFDNSFARELGDGFFREAEASTFPEPRLVRFNASLAAELGLTPVLPDEEAARLIVGAGVLEGAQPLAQVYAGHQFGSFSPQLGDGRALLLGEIVDVEGRRRDLQLKGSGPTPFSRGGDGKATLGPMLREYILGEAMHGLGIPTTRGLGVAATGEMVMRERPLPGAVLARVASSHLRVGTFEFFASRGDTERVRQLADYAIARHYPQVASEEVPSLGLLREVCHAQAHLVAQWMSVGFVHGVMNTDNVTISGETIDFGPCAFIDTYDPAAVFSSIDRHGRYAYGNQPTIMLWNMARFAETLLPLIDDEPSRAVDEATEVVESFVGHYETAWLSLMRAKLGLTGTESVDEDLAKDLLALMHERDVDFTSGFRALGASGGGSGRGSGASFLELFGGEAAVEASDWHARWKKRHEKNEEESHNAMSAVNPVYIPRNHKTEEALAAAVEDGNLEPFDRLVKAVSDPFVEQPELADHASPAPSDFGPYRTFCGT